MPIQILGAIVLAFAGGFIVWRLAADGRPYRSGPWPGLTPRGAGMIVGHAVLLAAGQLVVSIGPRDLATLCALSLAPLVLATLVLRMPGVASAVCGVYLLPRSLVSLLAPGVELPPLLLVPAMAFDVIVWLRRSDLSWGRRRRRNRSPRAVRPWRLVVASLVFAALLIVFELSS